MTSTLEAELKTAINSAIAEASRETGKPVIDVSFDIKLVEGQVVVDDVFIVLGRKVEGGETK